ncbi:hypothetical protein B0T24DRAFT_701186 [Lasiosphaeria ovina]|uniref:Uncharacterized protein n=1 Tax=Lasiosphaeria ovina TaxID=92902 RepID=A0AAE0KJD9_9PEZI|nr:hypothetical protein B0T24DRAFT_701186 [Lasiosphaeria ovina]
MSALFAAFVTWQLLAQPASAAAPGALSIWDQAGFIESRHCVSDAFINWDRGGLWNGALQCSKDESGSYRDSCACRCDLRPVAEAFVSSYAKSACQSNTVDIQSAQLLYDAYCATAVTVPCAGYTPVQVAVTLPTTAPATLSIWSADNHFSDARSAGLICTMATAQLRLKPPFRPPHQGTQLRPRAPDSGIKWRIFRGLNLESYHKVSNHK